MRAIYSEGTKIPVVRNRNVTGLYGNSLSTSKYVSRRHFEPLTDGKFAKIDMTDANEVLGFSVERLFCTHDSWTFALD